MKPADRTRLVMQAIGWQGGTVHDLCNEIGCDVDEFLYSNAEDAGVMSSSFTAGWFGIRTCSREFFMNKLLPANKGDIQFWLGVAAGLSMAPRAAT